TVAVVQKGDAGREGRVALLNPVGVRSVLPESVFGPPAFLPNPNDTGVRGLAADGGDEGLDLAEQRGRGVHAPAAPSSTRQAILTSMVRPGLACLPSCSRSSVAAVRLSFSR